MELCILFEGNFPGDIKWRIFTYIVTLLTKITYLKKMTVL